MENLKKIPSVAKKLYSDVVKSKIESTCSKKVQKFLTKNNSDNLKENRKGEKGAKTVKNVNLGTGPVQNNSFARNGIIDVVTSKIDSKKVNNQCRKTHSVYALCFVQIT